MDIGQNTKMKIQKSYWFVCENEGIYLHCVSAGLTLAGLDAMKPPVVNISVSVVGTSTILIPRTARSTTTGSA